MADFIIKKPVPFVVEGVDGAKYDAGDLGVPSFMNVADRIVYDYIQTQSAMIFDFE